MKTDIHVRKYLAEFLLEGKVFQTKLVNNNSSSSSNTHTHTHTHTHTTHTHSHTQHTQTHTHNATHTHTQHNTHTTQHTHTHTHNATHTHTTPHTHTTQHNTHTVCSVTLFRKLCRLCDSVEKYCTAGQLQMTTWRTRLAC